MPCKLHSRRFRYVFFRNGKVELQSQRFSGTRVYCNAQMGSRLIRRHCEIDASTTSLLESAVDKLGLSARAFNRILKIARTIADLAGKEEIHVDYVAEAIQYRSLDRQRK